MTLDQYGNYARWDATSGMVMAGGSGADGTATLDEVPIYAPGSPDVTDLAMGYDGILYVAVGGSLVMIDRRGRWPNFTLTAPDFSFWRLTALPEGGVLALDRNAPQLGKLSPVSLCRPGRSTCRIRAYCAPAIRIPIRRRSSPASHCPRRRPSSRLGPWT